MPSLHTLLQEQRDELERYLAESGRFNPKEPIYGEENRRELENLKSFLTSSQTQLLEGVLLEIEKLKDTTPDADEIEAVDRRAFNAGLRAIETLLQAELKQ